MSRGEERRAFAGILLGFALLYGYAAVVVPAPKVVDEDSHVQYAQLVRTEKRWPRPEDEVWNDKHPPLYYAAAAATIDLAERIAWRLPWWSVPVPGPFAGKIPILQTWRAPDGSIELRGASLLALRLLSVLFGIMGLWFTYRCVRLVLPEAPAAALGSLAFFAFNPRFGLQCSVIGNDAASVAAAGLAAWLLLRGVAGEGRFRPVLAGAACAVAFWTKVSCIFLLPAGLAVCLARRRREDARPAREAAAFVLSALLLASPWIVRNLQTFGEPLGVGGQIEKAARVFYPGPVTVGIVDRTVEGLYWSFWEPAENFSAGRVATAVLGVLGAMSLAGVAMRFLRRDLRESSREIHGALAVSLIAGAALYALVVVGNFYVMSIPGRLLFPAMPFAAVLFAAGLPVPFRAREEGACLPLAGTFAFLASLLFVFAVYVPTYRVPKSVFGPDTLAYVDPGHPSARESVKRGSDLVPVYLLGRSASALTASVDPDRVEVEIAGLDPKAPMRIEVTYASTDATWDDSDPASEPVVPHVVQQLRAGSELLHGPIPVTHRPRTYARRLPRSAVEGGLLRLAFEKVAGRFATVSEIRVVREPGGIDLRTEGGEPVLRVGTPPGGPDVVYWLWWSRVGPHRTLLSWDRGEVSGRGTLQLRPPVAVSGENLRLEAGYSAAPPCAWTALEAESLPHAGWRIRGDGSASGMYALFASGDTTEKGTSLPFSVEGLPSGLYDLRIRYRADETDEIAGHALDVVLNPTGRRYQELRLQREPVGGRLSGDIVFGGRGVLAIDRIEFVPLTGPARGPADVSVDWTVP
jgi:hypothetical protein